ncbi:hypothetical protein [Mucilaginibacter jinjuensis]|uniref:Uncharacterized protein n=1 Tax=Mucilaginibacter jinjuensis TaxID=1176721 RepID=A0ABY7TEQ9_9SPHI|nr:hypothetical protein [Mucilaginibacter jinjuensis]WCT14867.1 hypothetical protein PQO05_13055 [Mucilaginibacter jinjuensis]
MHRCLFYQVDGTEANANIKGTINMQMNRFSILVHWFPIYAYKYGKFVAMFFYAYALAFTFSPVAPIV